MITYGSNDASAGSITNATGLYVRPYHRGSTTINNSYAVRIVSPLTGATVTNQWGVYQDSTGMSNYFAGNVGVGTTAPDSKLQVEGTSSDASSAAIGATDSDGNTLLLVRNDGNVGIGTTAPDYKLQVLGGANFDNDGGTTSIVVGTGTNDEGATITFDDTNKYLGLSINGDSSNSFVVANGGNIGIGTTVPQSNLQVSGYIQLDLTSGAPPAADCDEASERGRMQVDNVNSVLYICVNSGWIAK
ncbi:MAG: hypothetical protein ISR65_15430 [Bacteriovoracaceae bacterium]|nr:hypothetical protein [Bacteriovoracaceae bacterium]